MDYKQMVATQSGDISRTYAGYQTTDAPKRPGVKDRLCVLRESLSEIINLASASLEMVNPAAFPPVPEAKQPAPTHPDSLVNLLEDLEEQTCQLQERLATLRGEL